MHMPERSCIVCRQKTSKYSLLRFVLEDQTLIFDPRYKESGRGAYLCPQKSCFIQAIQKFIFNKVLKTKKILISTELIQQVQCHIKNNCSDC
ncbi:DUF448 domain-containing protein [candidate division KSB1 bacterium]|jgi:hypothetical protein|nr:DUF448 domain-containing protein [candidate division KSB1 bacterium]